MTVAYRSFSDLSIFFISFMSYASVLSLIPSIGFDKLDGDAWISNPSISTLLSGFLAYYSLLKAKGVFLPFLSKLRISQPSCSRKMFFLLRLSLISLSCFLIGLLLRSIFWKRTCIKFAWHLLNCFIFFKCLFDERLFKLLGLGSKGALVCFFMLRWLRDGDWRGTVGFARPWTILSVF